MLNEQIWVEGIVESVHNDGWDTWLTINDPNGNNSFDFRIDGDAIEVPYDKEWWEARIGKEVKVSMKVEIVKGE